MEDGMSGAIYVPDKNSTSRAVRTKMAEVRRELARMHGELLELIKEEEAEFDDFRIYLSANGDGPSVDIYGTNPKYRYTGHVGGNLHIKST